MSLVSLVVLFAIPLISMICLKSFVGYLRASKQSNGSYPPGPKPKPLIGNLFDFPMNETAAEYVKWGKKYNSDILFGTVLGNHIMILNKQEDADELFERRARIYSDRPRIPILSLIGWGGMVSLLPYGNYWRTCRRLCQQHFNYESAKQYRPTIYQKVHNMLGALLESPDKFEDHNKMLSVSIAISTMYGYEVKSIDDPLIAAANTAMAIGASLAAPGGSLINVFPFLRHIPPWMSGPLTSRKAAAEALRLTTFMRDSMLKFAEETVANGTAIPSLVTNFMEKRISSGATEEEERAIVDVAFTTYTGATETTISATNTFLYLMVKHPEIQEKAQAEIDRVIGSTRLPEFEDRPALPYLEAIYREVMRWQQSLPLAVPHFLSEDDYYKGYFIPKGTTVIGNIWAMTHDEEVYSDPYTFNPDRFFDENGNLDDNNRVLSYGFGRRVCAGKHVASSTLWMAMASVLACFKVNKAKDEFGNEIDVNDVYWTEGYITHKDKYECSIAPRGPNYKELIAEKLQSYQ